MVVRLLNDAVQNRGYAFASRLLRYEPCCGLHGLYHQFLQLKGIHGWLILMAVCNCNMPGGHLQYCWSCSLDFRTPGDAFVN